MPRINPRKSAKKANLRQKLASQKSEIQSRVQVLQRERRRNLLEKALEMKEKDYPKFVSKLNEKNARWLIGELRKQGVVEGKKEIRPYKYEELLQQLAAKNLSLAAKRRQKKK